MKKITITYLPSLSSFLDEKDIKWEQENEDTISIYYNKPEDLFKMGIDYAEWIETIR